MNPDWPELAALVRIDLALSFDSRLGAQLYLPDVLHACISLVATGPAPIRAAVYGLLVNTVHSLAKDAAADAPKLKEILATLTGHEAERLFELTPPSDEPGATAWHVETSGEELVRLMSAIIDAGAPSTGAFLSRFPISDLSVLTTSLAFPQTLRILGAHGGLGCRRQIASSKVTPCFVS